MPKIPELPPILTGNASQDIQRMREYLIRFVQEYSTEDAGYASSDDSQGNTAPAAEITVDAELSLESTNPIQNRAVAEAFASLPSGGANLQIQQVSLSGMIVNASANGSGNIDVTLQGYRPVAVAVLSECRDFHIFELERDEEDIQTLMENEERFWNSYVLTGIRPPTDDSEATSKALTEMFPHDDGSEIILDVDEELLARRKILKDSEKSIRDELTGIDNELRAKIGNATYGICGPYKVSYKEQSTSGLDRQKILIDFPTLDFKNYATRARVLRVSAAKEKTA